MAEPSAEMISQALGEEIQRLRILHGWSRNDLAKRLPFTSAVRTLLEYELGRRKLSAVRLIEIARALGTDGPTLMASGATAGTDSRGDHAYCG